MKVIVNGSEPTEGIHCSGYVGSLWITEGVVEWHPRAGKRDPRVIA